MSHKSLVRALKRMKLDRWGGDPFARRVRPMLAHLAEAPFDDSA